MLKTAIKPELLFVLAAIAETKVSIDAKAELPKITHKTKDNCAWIGFPKKDCRDLNSKEKEVLVMHCCKSFSKV
jgi:hypothetical protein